MKIGLGIGNLEDRKAAGESNPTMEQRLKRTLKWHSSPAAVEAAENRCQHQSADAVELRKCATRSMARWHIPKVKLCEKINKMYCFLTGAAATAVIA